MILRQDCARYAVFPIAFAFINYHLMFIIMKRVAVCPIFFLFNSDCLHCEKEGGERQIEA